MIELQEYESSYLDDDLLDHELDGTECWEWQSIGHWSQLFSQGESKGKREAGANHGRDLSKTIGAGTESRHGK